MARKQRRYPPEFRQEIVALVRSGRSPEALAREFEPSASVVRFGRSMIVCGNPLYRQ